MILIVSSWGFGKEAEFVLELTVRQSQQSQAWSGAAGSVRKLTPSTLSGRPTVQVGTQA